MVKEDRQPHMEKCALNRRALELYLRFSYSPGNAGLFDENSVSYPEIRFASGPELTKEEYLTELNRILDDTLNE